MIYLIVKKTDTLKIFVVSILGMAVPELLTDVSDMCVSAAEALKRQCEWEYGFSDGQDLRATNISNLTPEQRAGLPTNNCISEQDLSNFVLCHAAEIESLKKQRISKITWFCTNQETK